MTSPADRGGSAPAPAPPSSPSAVFYWRPGCLFCALLRRALRRSGVTLDERNIWKDPEAAAFVRSVAGGNETVPTVVVAGTALVNPPARKVRELLGGEVAGGRRPRPRLARLFGHGRSHG